MEYFTVGCLLKLILLCWCLLTYRVIRSILSVFMSKVEVDGL